MILAIGSTTVDLLVTGVEQLPRWEGDEFAIDNLTWCPEPLRVVLGGNGANTAYALGRLGAAVTLASGLGQDTLGDLVTGWLESAGVDLRCVVRHPTAATATTTLILSTTHNRLIFHHAGAYPRLTAADLPADWAAGLQALLISAFPIMDGLRPHYAELLYAARAAGAHTVVDIGPAIGQPATLAELAPLLPAIDFLVTNEHELGVCAGAGAVAEQVGRLLAAGARQVIVKRGAQGVILWSAAEKVELAAFQVDAVHTIGAGDTFNAGFLFGLVQGWATPAAVRFGQATAALVVSSPRGVLGAPRRADVEEFLGRRGRVRQAP